MADRFEMAQRVWPILVEAAEARTTLTYLQAARRLGYKSARPMRQVLWPIHDYCKAKKLPPLTILVVNQSTGKPGGGFDAYSGATEEGQRQVFDHTWPRESPSIDD